MKRSRVSSGTIRIIKLINHCNTQVVNINEQAIIRALFTHVSEESAGGPVVSLEQLANEANISQASVSRFIRKVGYASFDEFRASFARDVEQLYYDRLTLFPSPHPHQSDDEIYDLVYRQALDNLRATYEGIDRARLKEAVRIMDSARTVTIYGDDHVLSDLYTFQLDLIARGVGAYLFKNEEIQTMHAQNIQAGDVVLFLTVSVNYIRTDQWEALRDLHQRGGVTTIGFSQDQSDEFEQLFDYFFAFGIPGSINDGFHSTWLLSRIMSELLYEL